MWTKRNPNIGRRGAAVLLLSVALLAACGAAGGAASQTAETVEVFVGDLSANATASGTLRAARAATLESSTTARVSDVLVRAGQQVAAGEPLVALDATDLELNVRAAQGTLRQAEAQLADLLSDPTPAEMAAAEAAVASAQAQLDGLLAGPSAAELASLESSLRSAEAAYASANAELSNVASSVSAADLSAAEAQLAAAQAQLTALQDAYDTILTTCVTLPDGSEVCPLLGAPEENARAQVAAAEANTSAAQLALAEARAGTTDAERGAANASVGVAAAQQGVAEAQRALLAAGAREEEIRLAEIAVEQARLGLTAAGHAEGAAEAAMAQAEAGVAVATAALAEARAARERTVLTAPFIGTLAELLVEDGEWATPGFPVARVGGGGWVVETTDLVELDVVRVAVGQPVEVTLDALPGETLRGTVVDIGRVPELVLGDVTYHVRIALDSVPEALPLRWGMTALVTIAATR